MRTLMIDDETYERVMEDFNDMREMYEDQSRDDWWDADDIAKELAYTLCTMLIEQEG